MRRFFVLVVRELRGIAFNPPTMFAAAFFVLLDSFAFYLLSVRSPAPTVNFLYIATFMLYTSILMHPFAARHTFSAENANGTLEALLTAPVSRLSVVLAKYTALMSFVVLYLVHGLVYAVLFAQAGNLDWGEAFAALAALFAVGSLAMALGIFVSSLTSSPGAATAGAGGILVFMALAADLDPYSGTIADILHAISFIPHAKRWIGGLLDTQGMVYFLTMTALFLFYAWLAISTQEPERKRINATIRRRLTITYILVCTGLFFLLLEAAVLNIGGYWDVGSQLGHTIFRVPWRNLIPLGFAAGAFIWSAFTFRAARRAQRRRSRRGNTKYATISESRVLRAPRYYYEENVRSRQRSVVAVLAAVIVVINLNWLAHYPFRTFSDGGKLSFLAGLQSKSWDVTKERRNTLTPATIRALDSLQGKLQIYSFLPDTLRVHNVSVATDLRSLINRYADVNVLVSAIYTDTRHDPAFARELALELDLSPDVLENMAVVNYQGRHIIIPAESFAVSPEKRLQMTGEPRWVFDGENRLTQAILHLTDPRVPRIFFSYGHQEHSLSAGLTPARSVARFAQALSGVNIRSRQHSFSTGSIPADCDLLAILAPRIPFKEAEAREIERYLDGGGRLLVVAPPQDPEASHEDNALNKLLFRIGGSFRDDCISDEEHNGGETPDALGIVLSGGAEGTRLLFPDARSIQDNPLSLENGWNARRMVRTFPSAVATAEAGNKTKKGPFTLVYRSVRHTPAGEARVVAISSAAAVSDAYVNRGANLSLLVSNAQWLAGREEAVDIKAREWVDKRLSLTGPRTRMFIWVALIALPLVWLAAGITAWWLRRD